MRRPQRDPTLELPPQGPVQPVLAAWWRRRLLGPSSWWESTASPAFVAEVLTKGLNAALAGELSDRVIQYLGARGKLRRRGSGVDCELLAAAARAVPSPAARLPKQPSLIRTHVQDRLTEKGIETPRQK